MTPSRSRAPAMKRRSDSRVASSALSLSPSLISTSGSRNATAFADGSARSVAVAGSSSGAGRLAAAPASRASVAQVLRARSRRALSDESRTG
ncbi:MAG: hypothetical protein LC785_03410 [Acidobacteria bacterium]|nr:hypothetical protein [Acidobacteriota bacterium]